MSDQTTEVVYIWTPDNSLGWVAYTSWDDLRCDIEGWSEDDIEGAIGTVKVERKPVGWMASLPEFEGW